MQSLRKIFQTDELGMTGAGFGGVALDGSLKGGGGMFLNVCWIL